MTTGVMPAAVYVGDSTITVEERPIPELGPHDVLVEVSHCGICGTDLHLVFDHYGRPGSILGHEWSGTVAAAGEAVAGEWEPGTRVVGNPTGGCGKCRACRRGRPSVCLDRPSEPLSSTPSTGAYCRFKAVPAARLSRIPDELPIRAAALTEPTAVALHAVNLSGVTPDDRVLVTGAGPVGLLTLAVLRARGIHDITVSEPADRRRARAQELGAVRVVHPDELPHSTVARPPDEPYSVVFECSGNPRAAESAFDQLDYAGVLVYVGTGSSYPQVNHNRMIVLELTLIGAYNYDAEGFGPALELLASGRMPLDLLIEPDDVSLDQLLPTLHRLAAGELAGKVMVKPEVSS
jgi:threonine dehydrogenase-like Zn-dependent dehydrogenase